MNPRILLPLLPVLLTACVTTTFQDTLVRASLDGPLPRAPVHLPGRDSSSMAIQGAFAFTATPQPRYDVTLIQPDKSDKDGNEGHGREVRWNHEVLMGSGEISLLAGRHVRLFAGAQGDLDKKAGWGGVGILLGRRTPLEIGIAMGSTTVSRELTGHRQTTRTDDCADTNHDGVCDVVKTVIPGSDTTVWDRAQVPFTRVSLTLSPREGGPWGELGYTSFKEVAHTVEGGWQYGAESYQVGAGWSFPTPAGSVVAGGRIETLGESVVPSLLVQWTGELPLD